jgi:site-specific recombinase XerD
MSIACRLRQGDLAPNQNRILRTPVHYLETGNYVHETVLPSSLRERFKHVAKFNLKHKLVAGRRPNQQWAIHGLGPEPAAATDQELYEWRFNRLKGVLTEHHTKRFSAWATNQQRPVNTLMRRLPYFSRALRLRALARGMEPAFYRQLETLPLPADTPAGLADFLAPSPAIGAYPVTGSAVITPNHSRAPWAALSSLTGTALAEQDLCHTVSANWAQDAKFLLNSFTTALTNQFGPKRLTPGQLKPLAAMLPRYLSQAEQIAPRTSAAYMALLWIGTKLHHREIAVSTARDYLSQIVINGALEYEAAFDFSDWDDEDVESVRLRVMNRRKLSDSTRQNRQDRLGQFLAFCQAHGLMAEATLEKEKLTYALTKRRNRVLGLAQFDQLQNTLTQSAEPEVALVNTLLTLGFYGGLRSGEMLALTLDDIEVCGPEIYVWIRRGKTPAARRKIPLHLIAPPRVCQQFLEYLDTRRAVARQYKAKPKKVAFIGPTGCVEGFARKEIVPAVIGLLRYYVGQDYEMHSLRHGFGTWLMLRAYALKYPELKGQLLEQQHVVFSGEGEKRFTQLFTWSEDQPLRQDRIDLFIHIRKIMGHSHISVLLQNYMHGFGVIHQFLMRRM